MNFTNCYTKRGRDLLFLLAFAVTAAACSARHSTRGQSVLSYQTGHQIDAALHDTAAVDCSAATGIWLNGHDGELRVAAALQGSEFPSHAVGIPQELPPRGFRFVLHQISRQGTTAAFLRQAWEQAADWIAPCVPTPGASSFDNIRNDFGRVYWRIEPDGRVSASISHGSAQFLGCARAALRRGTFAPTGFCSAVWLQLPQTSAQQWIRPVQSITMNDASGLDAAEPNGALDAEAIGWVYERTSSGLTYAPGDVFGLSRRHVTSMVARMAATRDGGRAWLWDVVRILPEDAP